MKALQPATPGRVFWLIFPSVRNLPEPRRWLTLISPLQLPDGTWQASFYFGSVSQTFASMVGTGRTREAAIEAAKQNIDELLRGPEAA